MKLELRHLRIVCAIADAGSVTKAAAALGLAQPALTAQLKRIERAIGGQLFDRDRSGARPTVLGELVLARARILLPAVQGLEDEAARLTGDGADTSTHRFGAVNGPILSGLVRRLTADHPRAVLSTYMAWDSSELADMLAAGRLDYALIGVCGDAPPPTPATPAGPAGPERGLMWHTIAVDPVFVMLPENHPLAGKDSIDLADLAGDRWTATRGNGCFESCFAAACARAGFTVQNMYEGDVRTCVELVESGAAIGACQASFRPPPSLVAVPIAGNPLHWRHLLGWRLDTPAGRHGDRIAGYAAAAYQDAVDRNARYAEWLTRHPQFGAVVHPSS